MLQITFLFSLALPTKVGIDSPTLKFPINDKTDRPAHLVHKLDAFLEINISTACKRHKNDLDRDVDDKRWAHEYD